MYVTGDLSAFCAPSGAGIFRGNTPAVCAPCAAYQTELTRRELKDFSPLGGAPLGRLTSDPDPGILPLEDLFAPTPPPPPEDGPPHWSNTRLQIESWTLRRVGGEAERKPPHRRCGLKFKSRLQVAKRP